MLRTLSRFTLLIALGLVAPHAQAQTTGRAFGFFLDCRDLSCDPDFYRQEIAFVDHVRDRTAADVHVLVTQQQTGGGGRAYTLAFYGQLRFDGVSDTLTLVMPQGSTEDEQRRALVRRIRLGLARYLARTPEGERAAVTLASSGPAVTSRATRDPWNAWVFETEAQVELEQERSSSNTELGLDVRADRITENWKTRISIGGDYEGESFDIDGERITSVRRDFGANVMQVRSLGRHWSAGLRLAAGSSTFQNQRLGVVIAPAVEYDLYPYDEATRRQLYIQYAVGGRSFRYEDTTVYFKLHETLPFE